VLPGTNGFMGDGSMWAIRTGQCWPCPSICVPAHTYWRIGPFDTPDGGVRWDPLPGEGGEEKERPPPPPPGAVSVSVSSMDGRTLRGVVLSDVTAHALTRSVMGRLGGGAAPFDLFLQVR
jgi:hypothetical protein